MNRPTTAQKRHHEDQLRDLRSRADNADRTIGYRLIMAVAEHWSSNWPGYPLSEVVRRDPISGELYRAAMGE